MRPASILVAVDASPAAAVAAEFAGRLGTATGRPRQLVHALRDPWAAALIPDVPEQIGPLTQSLYADARARVTAALGNRVLPDDLQGLIVQAGSVPEVVNGLAQDIGATLIVVGGKHHSLLGRWLSGSTALNLARTAVVPLLVTAGSVGTVRRMLVALDTSKAATPTLAAALQLAQQLGAELRAVSVIEPLPVMPESTPALDPTPYLDLCRDSIESELRPLVAPSGTELMVRTGPTVPTIEAEAASWGADLVVIGSHGKNWSQRLILGSATERLLNHLPASLLVVPVGVRQPAAVREQAPALVPAIG